MNKSNLEKKKKRVIVFGIFDGVHDGHRDLFRQAKEKGDELVVVVGRDSSVLKLKHKKPRYSEKERLRMVQKESFVDKAVLGDKELSVYKIIEQLKPDIFCLGYDQKKLKKDFATWLKKTKPGLVIALYTLKAYKPKTFHTSTLIRLRNV